MPNWSKAEESKVRLHIEQRNFGRYLDFYIFDGVTNSFVMWDLPKLVSCKEGEFHINNPSLSFKSFLGQAMIDNLYKLGFRTSDYLIRDQSNRDSHLADLRALVEKAYKVKLGGL